MLLSLDPSAQINRNELKMMLFSAFGHIFNLWKFYLTSFKDEIISNANLFALILFYFIENDKLSIFEMESHRQKGSRITSIALWIL